MYPIGYLKINCHLQEFDLKLMRLRVKLKNCHVKIILL